MDFNGEIGEMGEWKTLLEGRGREEIPSGNSRTLEGSLHFETWSSQSICLYAGGPAALSK